ncbi:MAG: hypothetical protein GF353_16215 [Candidatus Lokiarchaeota archaeon]|nr:hypothetical protein [Candidatus Lokiarchaeota archaeon]
MVNEEIRVPISEVWYSKLKKVGSLLNIDLNKLINLAFKEFFDMILNDTELFLDEIGLVDKLKNCL